MKSFLEFLIEMSVSDAMKLFGINEVPSSKEELNKHFKKLALKHHPDLGGSEETMKLLNQAKEILDKNLGYTSKKNSFTTKSKKDDGGLSYEERMAHVEKLIDETLNRFDEKIYKDYLEKAFGISFNVKKKITNPFINKNLHELTLEFADKDREKVFQLTFFIDEFKVHDQLYVVKSLSGSTDKTFEIGMYSFVFIDNKKQVLSKERYVKNDDSKIFTDPSILLPKTKITKLAKGEVRKNSKLAKRDFEGFFKAKYDAIIDSSGGIQYYYIPVHNGDYIVYIYRMVTFGLPTYRLGEVGTKPKSAWRRLEKLVPPEPIKFACFPEQQEGMDFIKKALADFDKTGDYKKFIKDYIDFSNNFLEKFK